MSLIYLYEQFENCNNQEKLLKEYELKFNRSFYTNLFLNDTSGKEQNNKNMFGVLLMNVSKDELIECIDDYIVAVMNYRAYNNKRKIYNSVFSNEDREIIQAVQTVKYAIENRDLILIDSLIIQLSATYLINKSDMFSVLKFGMKKYYPWSFTEINPILLIPAIARHMYKYHYKSRTDEETNKSHMAHTVCNLIMIYHILKRRITNV